MRKFLVLLLVGAGSLIAFAQGSMNLLNNLSASTFRSPIFGPVPSNPTLSIVGNGSSTSFFPQGTTSYQGAAPLSGSGFTLALFAGPTSVVDGSDLTLVTQVSFRTGAAAGFITASTVTVPGTACGAIAKFQIRVWDNKGGSVTSWAQAFLDNSVARGMSPVITTSTPLGGTDSDGNVFPINPDSTGWMSFNITLVPEPSTYALGGLGAVGLMLFRRRK